MEEPSLPESHESHELFTLLQSIIDAWRERGELMIPEGKRPMLEEYLALICADTEAGEYDMLVHDHAAFLNAACSLPGESFVQTRKRIAAVVGTEYDVASQEWHQAIMHFWAYGFADIPDDVLATFVLRADLLECINVCMCAGLAMPERSSNFLLEQIRLVDFFRGHPPHAMWKDGAVRARWMRDSIAGKDPDPLALLGLPCPRVPWQERGEKRHRRYVYEKLDEMMGDVRRIIGDGESLLDEPDDDSEGEPDDEVK